MPLRELIFMTTSECASAEKPRPPYCFGMIMPKKPFVLDELPHIVAADHAARA